VSTTARQLSLSSASLTYFYFFEMNFNVLLIFTPRFFFQVVSFPQSFLSKSCVHFRFLPFVLHNPPRSDHSNKYEWLCLVLLIIINFFYIILLLPPFLGPKVFLSPPFSQHPSAQVLLRM
jgi:hypothetical protein